MGMEKEALKIQFTIPEGLDEEMIFRYLLRKLIFEAEMNLDKKVIQQVLNQEAKIYSLYDNKFRDKND